MCCTSACFVIISQSYGCFVKFWYWAEMVSLVSKFWPNVRLVFLWNCSIEKKSVENKPIAEHWWCWCEEIFDHAFTSPFHSFTHPVEWHLFMEWTGLATRMSTSMDTWVLLITLMAWVVFVSISSQNFIVKLKSSFHLQRINIDVRVLARKVNHAYSEYCIQRNFNTLSR